MAKARGLQQPVRVLEAHLTRLSLETSYVRSEIGTLGCEASPNLYGYRLNRCTRVKSVLVTLNRSRTLSRPPLPGKPERLKGQTIAYRFRS